MYIKNIEETKIEKFYCGKMLARYIMERNIPLLARDGGRYVFSKTELLSEVLSFAPKLLVFSDTVFTKGVSNV